jgi:uncharacterized C2H2 Zn-finger protein
MATIEISLKCDRCGTELAPFYIRGGRLVYRCPTCTRLFQVVIDVFPTGEKEAVG